MAPRSTATDADLGFKGSDHGLHNPRVILLPLILTPILLAIVNPASTKAFVFTVIRVPFLLLFRILHLILLPFLNFPAFFIPPFSRWLTGPHLWFPFRLLAQVLTSLQSSLDCHWERVLDMWSSLRLSRAPQEEGARLPPPKSATKMKSSDAKRIAKDISESWGQHVESFVVNRISHTVSVFLSEESSPDLQLPHYHEGLPIIPHCLPKLTPTPAWAPFASLTNESITTHLGQAHLDALFGFFPGLVTADLFRDKIVYLHITESEFNEVLYRRMPAASTCFTAWGATFILLQFVWRFPRPRQPSAIPHDAPLELNPGSYVRNAVGAISTVGTYLQDERSKAENTAKHITVSGHSFVARRYLRLDGSTMCNIMLSIIVVAALSFDRFQPRLWDEGILIQYLMVKLVFITFEGKRTGFFRTIWHRNTV